MVAVKTYLTIIAVSLLLGLARSAAKDAADLVNEVRAGHTAARRSIQTLSASIRVELIKPISELLAAGKYWRVGDDVRVHQNTIYVSTIDYRVTNGEVRQITLPGLKGNGRSGPPGTAGWTTERDYSTRTNTFAEMLLILIDPDGNAIDLNSLLAAATTRVTSEREQLNGDDCVKLKLSVASRRGLITNYTLWHAKNRNYLITQVETNYDGSSDGRFIAKVTGWCELVPGVLVPIKVDSTIYKKGSIAENRIASLADVVVNAPIGTETMALPALPTGSIYRDEIAGVSVKVDSNWRAIGPITSVRQVVAPPQQFPFNTDEYTVQSNFEPKSVGFWVAAVSGGLLLLSTAVVAYRRYADRRR